MFDCCGQQSKSDAAAFAGRLQFLSSPWVMFVEENWRGGKRNWVGFVRIGAQKKLVELNPQAYAVCSGSDAAAD